MRLDIDRIGMNERRRPPELEGTYRQSMEIPPSLTTLCGMSLVDEVLAALRARHETTQRIDLNDIAEVIGVRAVSYEEVELIIATLEGEGLRVDQNPTAHEMGLLQRVLQQARKLRDELERNPTVEEIADAAELPVFVVRRALENANTLSSAKE